MELWRQDDKGSREKEHGREYVTGLYKGAKCELKLESIWPVSGLLCYWKKYRVRNVGDHFSLKGRTSYIAYEA